MSSHTTIQLAELETCTEKKWGRAKEKGGA
jgi:hypothetical protein